MSYANLSDMLAERGISVNRSTIYRWFIEYASVLRKKLRRYQFIRTDTSWQLGETYVKVKGKRRCLIYYDVDNQPKTLNTDKHSSYANAIAPIKKAMSEKTVVGRSYLIMSEELQWFTHH